MRRLGVLGVTLTSVAALLLTGCSSSDDTAGTTTTAADDGAGDEAGAAEGTGDGSGSTDPEPEPDAGTPSADEQEYIQALVTSMKDDDDVPFDESQMNCIATRWVDVISIDRFRSAGLEPADLAEDDDTIEFTELDLDETTGNELYDAFGACDVDLRQLMLEDEDDEMSAAAKACMESVFTEDNVRLLMVKTMVYGEDAAEKDPELGQVMGALIGCAFMDMGAESGSENDGG